MTDGTPPPRETIVRVCPTCSVQSSSPGAFCPHCGTAYMRSRTGTPATRSAATSGPRSWVLVGVGSVVVVALVIAVALLLRDQDDSAARQGDATSATDDFLDAVHEDQALAYSSGLLPSDEVLVEAGSAFCEARGSGEPFNEGQLFVLDYLRPQVSDDEYSTLVLVSDAAATHLCPVEGLDD